MQKRSDGLLTALKGNLDILVPLQPDKLPGSWRIWVNELRARVRAGKRILVLQNALMQAHTALQFKAAHDHLTGLWNRGAIMDLLQRETQRSARIGEPLGVIMADLDHFKRINDSHGHQ